jgi:hypothetical protein
MLRDAMPLNTPMTAADIVKAIGIPQLDTSNVAAQIGTYVDSSFLHRETRPKGGGAYQYTRLRGPLDTEPNPNTEKYEKHLFGGTSITLPKMPSLSVDK